MARTLAHRLADVLLCICVPDVQPVSSMQLQHRLRQLLNGTKRSGSL